MVQRICFNQSDIRSNVKRSRFQLSEECATGQLSTISYQGLAPRMKTVSIYGGDTITKPGQLFVVQQLRCCLPGFSNEKQQLLG